MRSALPSYLPLPFLCILHHPVDWLFYHCTSLHRPASTRRLATLSHISAFSSFSQHRRRWCRSLSSQGHYWVQHQRCLRQPALLHLVSPLLLSLPLSISCSIYLSPFLLLSRSLSILSSISLAISLSPSLSPSLSHAISLSPSLSLSSHAIHLFAFRLNSVFYHSLYLASLYHYVVYVILSLIIFFCLSLIISRLSLASNCINYLISHLLSQRPKWPR